MQNIKTYTKTTTTTKNKQKQKTMNDLGLLMTKYKDYFL
jgi:hypothetical protein